MILAPEGIAGSTLPAQRLPWRSAADLPPSTGSEPALDVDVGGERYQAVVVPGSPASVIRIVSLQSSDRALAPYRSIQLGLMLLGVVAAVAGIAGSAVLARSLTAPIAPPGGRHTGRSPPGNLQVPLAVARERRDRHLARRSSR